MRSVILGILRRLRLSPDKGSLPDQDRGMSSSTFSLGQGLSVVTLCFSLLSSPAFAQTKQATRPSGVKTARTKSSVKGKPSPIHTGFDPFSARSLKLALDQLNAQEKAKDHDRDAERESLKVTRPTRRGSLSAVILEEKEENGADALGALYHYLSVRAYPGDTVDPNTAIKAAQHRDRMAPAFIGSPPGFNALQSVPVTMQAGGGWEFVGPTNYQPPYQWGFGIGAMNGRVNDVVFDPKNTSTFYLASAGGGIWKSTNNGKDWKSLSAGWPATQSYSITVDPTNSNRLYAGTGDLWYKRGFGLMASSDAGATWKQLGASVFGTSVITRALVDPENPQIITVSPFDRGKTVYRSTNGGVSWVGVIPAPAGATNWWFDLSYGSIDSATGKRSYYAVGVTNNGTVSANAYRSQDQGATWTKLTLPAITSSGISRVSVSASPTSANVVYVGVAYSNASGASTGKVFRSGDRGATWTDITGPASGDLLSASWGQSWYDFYVTASSRVVNGVTRDMVYVGLIDILEYVYTGNTSDKWVSINRAYTGVDLVHVDQHRLNVNPNNPNNVVVGNDGGVYQMDYDGSNWTPKSMNRSLGMTQFYSAAYHPSDSLTMMAGAQDNGTAGIGGDPGNWYGLTGGDGGYCAINQSDPTQFFTSSQFLNIYYYDSAGWNYITPGYGNDNVAFIAPFILDPADQGVLYAGTSYLYRWTKSSGSWENRLGNQKLSANGAIRSIAVAPSDKKRIYTGSSDGEVWMTADRGATWSRINSGTTSLPNRAIMSIAVQPDNPDQILVGVSGSGTGHLWRCDNTLAGATRAWTNVSGSGSNGLPDISLNSVALGIIDPVKAYYVGTDVGVFTTSNGGLTWANATQPLGLPPVQVNDLKVVPGTGYLNAATFGRGIWRISLAPNPLPVLSSLEPSQAIAGSGDTPLTVNGSGFIYGATARFGTTILDTVYVSPTKLTTTIPSSLLQTVGPVNVVVTNPFPGGGDSNALTFQVQIPLRASISTPTISNGMVNAIVSIYNDRNITASGVQIKDIEVTFRNNKVKGAPLPLNIGSIPGNTNGKPFYINRAFSFPASVANSGDTVTVTYKGSCFQPGATDFTLIATLKLP